MTCPWCGAEDVHRDEVDVGVGTIFGPAACEECHSYQIDSPKDHERATKEERKVGWIKGDRL